MKQSVLAGWPHTLVMDFFHAVQSAYHMTNLTSLKACTLLGTTDTSQLMQALKITLHTVNLDDAVALLLGQRTCDLQAAGSSPGWLHCAVVLGKLLTPVCLCHHAV